MPTLYNTFMMIVLRGEVWHPFLKMSAKVKKNLRLSHLWLKLFVKDMDRPFEKIHPGMFWDCLNVLLREKMERMLWKQDFT
jgi:hypothetical protein